MRISRIVLAAVLGLCFALPAAAQYTGVLQSAETMDRGTFKLMAAPIMVFGKNGADDEFGGAFRGGYAFTDRFDLEAKLGFFENSVVVGADAEFWVLSGKEEDTGLDISLTGGLHWIIGNNDNFDIIGLEITPEFSGHVTKNIELCGTLDTSFESIKDAPEGVDDTFWRVHLVPGIEYRLTDQVDLEGEVGIGLNDDSYTYAGVGIIFYFRSDKE